MFAEILTIGDELCRGEIVDTNSSWLAARLWERDVTVRWKTSCRDDDADLRAALTTAAGRADLVITSGGLGPTEDDLTVDVIASLVGTTAEIDEAARAAMAARFGERASHPLMLRQVRVPSGARVHANRAGLAPGFEIALAGTPVVALPGVPRELHAIWDGGLADRIAAIRAARGDAPALARRTYRAFGLGESQLSAKCRGLVDGTAGASIHYQVKFPEVLIKLLVRGAPGAQGAADAALAALEVGLRERLGDVLYGDGEPALPARVTAALAAAGVTVAVAESCTAGLLGSLLTEAPGASASFRGGAICYADAEKTRQLGVPAELIAEHGAVSEACAIAMARGALARFGVDRAVAITGIAGPDGGTADKPVGTVWVALARRDGDVVVTKSLAIPMARDQVRLASAWWGLALLRASLPAV